MFKVDFSEGKAIEWHRRENGQVDCVRKNYNPSFYVSAENIIDVRSWVSRKKGVRATCFESWKTSLGSESIRVLRIDVDRNKRIREIANKLSLEFGRSNLRFFNVDISPQFRYCLQKNIRPVPESDLQKIEISLSEKHIAEQKLSEIKVDGKKVGKNDKTSEKFLENLFDKKDPDIVLVNDSKTLEILEDNFKFSLGRKKGFETLAKENTVKSYGKTLHSSARYNIPGRIVIDRSNSFMLGETNLRGMWDLVKRSWKPLQELSWGSIGNILTAIEIRKAFLEENTLTCWKNWEGEVPKKANKLHKGDRGGFIFSPEPDIYEDVYEVDFASLYPNIMVNKNISPETVNCSCCSNSEVPELDFTLCEKKGFIPRVLEPLVEDRRKMKEELSKLEGSDSKPERQTYLKGSIGAIKWILVSCFGYMGHKHASYGAIRCHQAINAFDRDIMVEAKEIVEKNGYEVKHGIVDSIWIRPKECAEDIEKVCREVTDKIGIELEKEYRFDWVAFVPRKDSDIATLNRYFGKKKEGGFKTAGIEMEQRSTCRYIKDCQEDLIKIFDENRNSESILKALEGQISRLESGSVDTDELIVTRRCSKPIEEYKQYNLSVAGLERAKKLGVEKNPGQDIEFVVKDNSRKDQDRLELSFENPKSYDICFYRKRLVKAATTVLSPLGIKENEVKQYLSNHKELKVNSFQG